jgi:hypothetical protein
MEPEDQTRILAEFDTQSLKLVGESSAADSGQAVFPFAKLPVDGGAKTARCG